MNLAAFSNVGSTSFYFRDDGNPYDHLEVVRGESGVADVVHDDVVIHASFFDERFIIF